jgi:hypothetical protein
MTQETQSTQIGGSAGDSSQSSGRQRAGGKWVEDVLRPVLLAGMLVCVLAPIVFVLEWMIANWDGTYFLIFAFFAGLEGVLSERALQKRHISDWAYLVSRGAEALILLIVLSRRRFLHGRALCSNVGRLHLGLPHRHPARHRRTTGRASC